MADGSRRALAVAVCVGLAIWGGHAAGESPVAAVVGNGGLTAGLDSAGRVVSCRWPSPGFFEHLGGGSGLRWRLEYADGDAGGPGEGWRPDPVTRFRQVHVAELTFVHERSGARVEQTAFVAPDEDLLVVRLEGEAPAPSRVTWVAPWVPTLNRAPAWPEWGTARPAPVRFGAFAAPESDAVVAFQPGRYDADAVRSAKRLAADEAGLAEWAALGPGVWVAMGAEQPLTSRQVMMSDCMVSGKPDEAAGRWSATLYVSVAGTASEALRQLEQAPGYETLRDRLRRAWSWMLGHPIGSEPFGWATRTAARARIAIATDRRTGAVAGGAVRAGTVHVHPEGAAWAGLALLRAGDRDSAQRLARVLLAGARAGAANEAQVPLALHADGESAAPAFLTSYATNAWALWLAARVAEALPGDEGKAFVAEQWPGVMRLAHLLTAWRDRTTGHPLAAYDRVRNRFTRDDLRLVDLRLGLAAARDLAEVAGLPAPEWRERLAEVDALMESRSQREPDWASERYPALWASGAWPRDDARWARFADARFARWAALAGGDRLSVLAVLAEVAGGNASLAARVVDRAEDVLAVSPPGGGPDAYAAARLYTLAAATAQLRTVR